MKKTFIFYKDRQDYLSEMSDEEKGRFFQLILDYQNGQEVDGKEFKFIRNRIKKQMDEDFEKREKTKAKRAEAGKLGGLASASKRKQMLEKASKTKQMIAKASNAKKKQANQAVNVNVNVNDNDNVNDKKDDTIVSQRSGSITGVGFDNSKQLAVLGEKEKSSAKKEKDSEKEEFGNPTINNIIETIKKECLSLGVAYDSKMERSFARHIATAKQYGSFAEDLGQSRLEFAINILRASIAIDYFKGPTAGPKAIYQNYSEVYNQTKMKQKKRSSVVGVL